MALCGYVADYKSIYLHTNHSVVHKLLETVFLDVPQSVTLTIVIKITQRNTYLCI